MNTRIALDAMGGDHGVSVTVPAALAILRDNNVVQLILVGDENQITAHLGSLPATLLQRVSIRHASQVVSMDELPSHALRGKKDSSMRVALNLVKEGEADACVSAGNTGALMATSRYVLKTLPGIDRPAIMTTLPTIHSHVHMLDLGANVDSSAKHLFQFAVMGSVLARAVDNVEQPKVGLLNIGQEEMKGNEVVKEAGRLLSESSLNYVGFVEGDDIYTRGLDVVVCDGFAGNISLKTTEGVAKMIVHYAKRSFKRNWYTRLAALMARPVLRDLQSTVDPRRYNGASLLGLRGIVIKSHGSADVYSFSQAIREAIIEVQKNVPSQISHELDALLNVERSAS